MPTPSRIDEIRAAYDRRFPPEARFRSLLGDRPEWRVLADSILARTTRGEPVDLPAELYDAGVDWTRTIKAIRMIYGNGIPEAQHMTLSHPRWLRWCKRRIATDAACRRQVHFSAKTGSLAEWIGLRDGEPVFLK